MHSLYSSNSVYSTYTNEQFDHWIEAARFCRLAYIDEEEMEKISKMTKKEIEEIQNGLLGSSQFSLATKRQEIWPAFGYWFTLLWFTP